jgi:putative phosphoesterase
MSSKIAVITDVHANLPALEAALGAIYAEGVDAIFHTGDAIAIGPYPAECLDLLLHIPNIHFIMGNHDAWYVDGLPTPQPTWMSDGEVQHQHWTHASLGPQFRPALAQWPYSLTHEIEGVQTTFVHYALLPSGHDWRPIIPSPTSEDLDRMFEQHRSALVFYGHHHPFSDLFGHARYVNPGSLGCYDRAVARYAIAEYTYGQVTVTRNAVAYDDHELGRAFEQRNVPERKFIARAFFGGRFRG